MAQDLLAWVRGRVLRADGGRPLPGSKVHLLPWGARIKAPDPDAPDPVLADKDGRFRFRVPRSHKYLLAACKGGFLDQVVGPLTAGDAEQELTVRLRRGATAEGSVAGLPRRTPVAFAKVSVDPMWALGQLKVPNGLPPTGSSTCIFTRVVTTQRDGRFRLTGLAPGQYLLRVEHPDWSPRRLSVTVGPGASSLPTRIELVATGELHGACVRSGLPVSNVNVRLVSTGRASEFETDGNGRFRFTGVQEGLHELRIAAPPGSNTRGPRSLLRWEVRVQPGQLSETTLDMSSVEPLEVSGRVFLDGQDLQSAHLRLQYVPGPEQRFRVDPEFVTVANGRFNARLGLAGRYRCRLTWSDGGRTQAFSTELRCDRSDSVLEIRIPSTRLSVRVFDRDSGRPVRSPLSLVRIEADGSEVVAREGSDDSIPDPRGRFEFGHVAPGRYVVVCHMRDLTAEKSYRSTPVTIQCFGRPATLAIPVVRE